MFIQLAQGQGRGPARQRNCLRLPYQRTLRPLKDQRLRPIRSDDPHHQIDQPIGPVNLARYQASYHSR